MGKNNKTTGQAAQTSHQAPNPTAVEADTATEQAARGKGTATVTVALNRATGILFPLPGGRKALVNGNAAHLRGKEKGVLPVGDAGALPVPAVPGKKVRVLT